MKKLLIIIPIMLAMLTCLVPLQSKGLLIYVPGNREFWEAAQFEKMEVFFSDGFRFYITTHEIEHISVSAKRLDWIIRNIFRRYPADVKQLTHNHFECRHVSKLDLAFWDCMKLYGFRGKFTIWFNGQFYDQ